MTDSSAQSRSVSDSAPGSAPAGSDQLLEQLRRATVGEYDIYGELGRGGMATVFLAHDLSLDRKVAIKVMSPALLYGSGMVERFKREARTAAHLSHPNIIPVYAVRESEGLLFFVMKLVEGTPLDAIMRDVGKLPLPMVEAILAQVGGAFGYAHRHGVVHRDIKPSNILIDDEGWAVVTDFGIAKVQESEQLTQSGVAVGTPTYMSPEQCSGGVITGASDQYSLAVVAYEMLAGRPPFVAQSMMALMYNHFHDPVPPLELFRPDCSEAIRSSLLRMLEKDPEKRWPSMEDAIAAMGARQLAHDDPTRSQLISLARTGVSHRIISQVQTPRSPVPLTRSRPGAATPAPANARSPRSFLWLGGATVLAAGIIAAALLQRSSSGDRPAALPDSAGPARVSLPPAPAPVPNPPSVRPPGPGGRPDSRRAAGSPVPLPPTRSASVESAGAGQPAVLPPAPVPTAAPAPVPAPAPPPPPAPLPAAPPATEVAAVSAAAAEAEVEAAILSYARALDAGDLAAARRVYPGMPAEQRQGLEAFWKAGGTMRSRWVVSDVTVSGDEATARVEGTNLVSTPRQRASEQRVDLRARLERRGGEWRLLALVN